MSSVPLPSRSRPGSPNASVITVGLLLVGLAVLLLPLFISLANTIWKTDEQGHGPIVFAVSAWLFWRSREELLHPKLAHASPSGWVLLVLGLAIYAIGRSQGTIMLEVGSIIPILAGAIAACFGWRIAALMTFPILFLVFAVPIPSFVIDKATGPLKQSVSNAAESILYMAGYPIARSGVVLSIGQYQLLVADACSGLNSMFSLSAIGVLYLYLMRYTSVLRNLLIVLCILPIAFCANVVRVMVLVLITYYFGDEAGQGFAHGLAGMLLFLVALGLLLVIDAALGLFFRRKEPAMSPSLDMRTLWRPVLALLLMLCAAFASVAMKPVGVTTATKLGFKLDDIVPQQFGSWHIDTSLVPIAPPPDVQASLDRIYSQVLTRTYINGNGQRVMLSIAYGDGIDRELDVHRPEYCYPAQGFTVSPFMDATMPFHGDQLPVRRLVARMGQRNEPITYWITIGDSTVSSTFDRKILKIKQGLTGQIGSGMLVRVSTIDNDATVAYAVQQQFIDAMLSAMPAGARKQLAGKVGSAA